MANAKKKNDNIFVAYFTPFGIKQICDILIFVTAILITVGTFAMIDVLLIIGLSVFIAADLVILVRHILVLASKVNRRSPEYKAAFLGTIISGIMLLLATFALIYFFLI